MWEERIFTHKRQFFDPREIENESNLSIGMSGIIQAGLDFFVIVGV